MEFSVVLYPTFFRPFEKTMNSLQSVLDTPGARRTAEEWFTLASQHDFQNRPYIVTAMSHYKESAIFPDRRHEYIVLEVEQKNPPSPVPPPILIRVSRTIGNQSLLARLGLWGPATDTVEIIQSGAHFPHQCLHRLTWPRDQAPDLRLVTMIITVVHREMPRYCLLKTSCYAFVGAIKDCIYIQRNGLVQAQRPPFLTRPAHFMRCIPVGITRAQRIARSIARTEEANEKLRRLRE